MRVGLITGAFLAALAFPAMASQCPSSVAALDDHLRLHGSMLTQQAADQVRELRDKAAKLHSIGDHAGAMEAIQQVHRAMGM